MRHRKCTDSWREKTEADHHDPRRLSKSVDTLLGRSKVSPSSILDVDSFCRFFAEKVAKVRDDTSNAPPPTFSRMEHGNMLIAFSPVTTHDVIKGVRRLPAT